MGDTVVNRACGPGPVTCVLSSGWPDYCSGSSSQLPGLRRRVGGGPVGAPAAAQRRGRTSWTPTSGGGSSGGEGFLSCWWWGRWCSRRVVGGVVSQAPIRRLVLQRAGRHDHVSGDRAAQSDDRARPGGRLMPRGERTRGLATSLVCGCVPSGAGDAGCLRGEQVVGASQQLAGDRDGGDLLPAAFRAHRPGHRDIDSALYVARKIRIQMEPGHCDVNSANREGLGSRQT
jgi:hypothetical protein